MIKKFLRTLKDVLSPPAENSLKIINLGSGQYHVKRSHANKLATDDTHEPWLDTAYRAAFHTKEGVFIDVGVNVGQSLMKVLSMDKDRRYVGFEPQLDCCFYVDQFIKENELNKYNILPIGLSNFTGIIKLLKRINDSDTTASTIKGFRPDNFYTAEQSIYVTNGDDVLPAILNDDSVSIIKIDVEGAELEVMDGLKKTMGKYTPIIIFEILNHYLVATGQQLDPDIIKFREERNQKMEAIFREIGYCIFNVLPDNKLIEVMEIQPEVSSDLSMTDYIAVHDDDKNAFLDNFKSIISQ